jgi:hypothetical protein
VGWNLLKGQQNKLKNQGKPLILEILVRLVIDFWRGGRYNIIKIKSKYPKDPISLVPVYRTEEIRRGKFQ